MKLSQSETIVRVLSDAQGWVPSYNLEKVETPWGFIGTSGLRRCRELVAAGKIEKREQGKFVWYRIAQPAFQPTLL